MSEYVEMEDIEFERFKLLCQLRRLSVESGEPDNPWDGESEHYFLMFNVLSAELQVDFVWDECHNDIYFPSHEAARMAAEQIGVNRLLKYWFGLPDLSEEQEGDSDV